jgi:SAM-dependent methyltransferase
VSHLEQFSQQKYSEDFSSSYLQSRRRTVRNEIVLSLVGDNRRVLDVGCHDGSVGQLLVEKGNSVFGFDLAHEALGRAAQRGLIVTKASAERILPFADGSFDVVFLGELIEHVLDTDLLMREVKRVLRSDGCLVLTTPNAASLGRRLLLFLGMNPHFEASFTWPGPPRPAGHIRFFTRGLLTTFLEYHDLEIVHSCSNVVIFTLDGRVSSRLLAKLFPSLGSSLIVKARNQASHSSSPC